MNQDGTDWRIFQDHGASGPSLPVLVHPPIFTILVPFHDLGPSSHPHHPGSNHVAIRRHAALPVREPSRLPPFGGISPSFGKIIWQCYSELAGGGKNTLASPLEVNVFCPYLCTTPQGRDGLRATETREGKGKQSCTIAGHADHREKGLENYLKKDFAVSKKVPTFAVPTKGNSEGRDVRSERK